MTFLPIVGRELRVAARRRGTYWTRLGIACVAIAFGGWVMLIPDFRTPQNLGLALFTSLAVVAFIYSLLAGVRTTADCLSEEKREGTLGLLFLTDLKGYDIVFGKLTATSVNAAYGLLAIFPVMAIPLLLGGVTVQEFWRAVLVSINSLFFSLAVGMFCSAVSLDERKAMALTSFILLLFALGLPVAGIFAQQMDPVPRPLHPLFFIPSPGYAAFMSFDATATTFRQFNFFYASVLCVHLIGWAFLVAACVIVPRSWQDRAETGATSRWRARWRRWGQGLPAARQAIRARMLAINPFYWLAGRDRMKTVLVWVFLGGCAGFALWCNWKFQMSAAIDSLYVCTALVVHTVLKCWIAFEACRRFNADRKSGALELLLSTPLSVREILGGQLRALWKQFGGPLWIVLIADCMFFVKVRNEAGGALACLAGIAMLLADVVTLSWVGMWFGLRSRGANRAIAAAVALILVLPWGVFALAVTLSALTNAFITGIFKTWDDQLPYFLWMAIGLANDLVFGLWARSKLVDHFRDVVTQRFETRWRAGSG